jgi:hypothetical protein
MPEALQAAALGARKLTEVNASALGDPSMLQDFAAHMNPLAEQYASHVSR